MSGLCVEPEDFIRINVCGHQYTILQRTLEKFPLTLLGDKQRREEYYVDFLDAYYFDQKREVFESILYYYQSDGFLVRPRNIPMDLYAQVVRFFGISEEVLTNMQKLEGYVEQKIYKEDADELPSNNWQRKLWVLMEYPESSVLARIIGLISVSIILLSILTFCMETLPQYHHHHGEPTGTQENCATNRTSVSGNSSKCDSNTAMDEDQFGQVAFEIVEYVSAAWFSLEYIVRLLASPNKWNFFKSTLNLIDLCAILPYIVVWAINFKHGSSFGVIRVARLVRVFRVLKLSRHFLGLQLFGNTLIASINELAMILFMVCFSVVIFSSAMFYAEHDDPDASGTEDGGLYLKSIPDAFWLIVVTMTTVGYGDYYPLTFPGKVVGGVCAITGVLVIAMVVPVISSNFEFFYKRDKMNVARKEEKRLKMVHTSTSEEPAECETSLNDK